MTGCATRPGQPPTKPDGRDCGEPATVRVARRVWPCGLGKRTGSNPDTAPRGRLNLLWPGEESNLACRRGESHGPPHPVRVVAACLPALTSGRSRPSTSSCTGSHARGRADQPVTESPRSPEQAGRRERRRGGCRSAPPPVRHRRRRAPDGTLAPVGDHDLTESGAAQGGADAGSQDAVLLRTGAAGYQLLVDRPELLGHCGGGVPLHGPRPRCPG